MELVPTASEKLFLRKHIQPLHKYFPKATKARGTGCSSGNIQPIVLPECYKRK